MAKVLIAYDGTPSAKRALERAAQEHRPGVDEIGIISVALVTSSGPRSAGPIDPVENLERHGQELDEAVAYLAERGISAETIAATGEPGAAICRAAEEKGYDRIVVGSRNLGGVKRMLLGSISDRVAHHAHCDVLIAR